MKVKFTTNLGSRQAEDLGCDHEQCVCGATVDVSEQAASVLTKLGIAEAVDKPKQKPAPKPKTVEAVPETPTIAEAEKPAIKGEAKPETSDPPADKQTPSKK